MAVCGAMRFTYMQTQKEQREFLSLGLRSYRPFTSFNNCALLAILIKYRVCMHGFSPLFPSCSRCCCCCTHRLLLHGRARACVYVCMCMCRHCCCRYVQHFLCMRALTRSHSLSHFTIFWSAFQPLHSAILSWFYFEMKEKIASNIRAKTSHAAHNAE